MVDWLHTDDFTSLRTCVVRQRARNQLLPQDSEHASRLRITLTRVRSEVKSTVVNTDASAANTSAVLPGPTHTLASYHLMREICCSKCESVRFEANAWVSRAMRESWHVWLHHPHIASDLRDGLCSQSVSSDIFSLGRVISIINSESSIKNETLNGLSHRCMQYHMHLRPDILYIKQAVQ